MKSESGRYAKVKVENEQALVVVPVSSGKPEIPEKVQDKWQKIVDLIAQIMQVPTGLITRFTEENLEVFVASNSEGNPYKRNDKDRLGIGMFCETVVGRRNEMVVSNTGDSEYWINNPHAGFGMKSYLGVPIQWEDGEVFGTFCMLDDKANRYSKTFQELMLQFKEIIETDLKNIQLQEQLQKKVSVKELQIREVHHRIKNHFNLLISMIRLQSKDAFPEVHDLLQEFENRVRTLSLLHEKLYQRIDKSVIPLDLYLKQLTHYICDDFSKKRVQIIYDIDPIMLSAENSLPCGLIVSELFTNSIKHAFAETESPEIEIHFHKRDDKTLVLQYKDNGIGLPWGFLLENTKSMGISLIKLLVNQMEGTMDLKTGAGAEFNIVLHLG